MIIHPDIRNLIPTYLRRRIEDIVKLKENLAIQDFIGIQKIGHRLNGSGKMYGFDQISKIGGELELTAMQHDETAVARNVFELEKIILKIKSQNKDENKLE